MDMRHSIYRNVTQHVPKVAQQTALRAAFLVDQAIQEKQVIYLLSR